MPGTVRLHRVLATTPEKVYRAFIEADALAKNHQQDPHAKLIDTLINDLQKV